MIRIPGPDVKVTIGMHEGSHRVSDCVRAEPGDDRLEDVLKAATEHAATPNEFARAWHVLLRLAVDNPRFLLGALEKMHTVQPSMPTFLVPLFAFLAHSEPARVARLFPHFARSEAAVLCGEHGLDAAVRELGSGQFDHRQESAFLLQGLAESGADVPSEPLVRALAFEGHEDVVSSMQIALRVVLEGGAT